MRTSPFGTALLLLPFSILPASSAPIQNLTFTDVIKDVSIIDAATKKETPAKVGDTLVPPNVLKTGPDSRAELIAEDKTVTRLGANTIFSVEANTRDVNLAQGSVLFHSPTGRGGGRIKSAGATASVLGTTLTVSANPSGGFKTSLLEGKGEVKGAKGGNIGLTAGQVTFAKPGGGLSPALNFDLKAQVANSKLVGGFSKPLASLAKIDAAISVQQAKIAKGELGQTGLLIGDRPDTAFKVEIPPDLITQAVKQKKAAAETQTFFTVDPRYLASVSKTISLDRQSPVAPELDTFYIDGSGLANRDGGGVAGVPKAIPGNRQEGGGNSALIAENVSISLEPKVFTEISGVSGSGKSITLPSGLSQPDWLKVGVSIQGANVPQGTTIVGISGTTLTLDQSLTGEIKSGTIEGFELPSIFLHTPVLPKDGSAILALKDLSLSGSMEFVGHDNATIAPDGTEVGRSLLLSAGNTLKIAPGSMLLGNASVFELFAAGSAFTPDLNLSVVKPADGVSPTPLTLDRVAIVNNFPLDDASTAQGLVRIAAPSLQIKDSYIFASSTMSEVALEADGNVSIGTNLSGSAPASDDPAKKLLVSLGLTDPRDLCVQAYKVGITSKTKAIDITGVRIFANEIAFSAGDTLTLSSVSLEPYAPDLPQKLDMVSKNDLTILTGSDEQDPISLLHNSINASLTSTFGNVEVRNTSFGAEQNVPSDDSLDPSVTADAEQIAASQKTSFSAVAAKALLLNNTAIHADNVLFEGNEIRVQGVTIAPTDTAYNQVKATSKGDMIITNAGGATGNPKKVTVVTAYKIDLAAGGDLKITNSEFYAKTSKTTFSATAAKDLDMNNVRLEQAQKVALQAQTVILENVSFMADSEVSLKSAAGVLSTPASRSAITPLWINVLGNVKYGTYVLGELSNQINNPPAGVNVTSGQSVTNTVTKGIADNASFHNALKAQFGKDLPNINIGKK